jgi:endonuclease YncB( thermonuclease family)
MTEKWGDSARGKGHQGRRVPTERRPVACIPFCSHRRCAGMGRLARSLVAALLAAFSVAATAAGWSGRVVSIHDGDTMTVLLNRQQVRVRLDSIDAPELGQAFGKRSKESLAALCAAREARIEDRGEDRYGRVIGRVTCAGVDANAEQVRRGMAWVFVKYAPKGSPLYRFEDDARIRRHGLWADPKPVPPWDWRAIPRSK